MHTYIHPGASPGETRQYHCMCVAPMCVRMYERMYVRTHVRMNVCAYVRVYACMHVRMHVPYTYILIHTSRTRIHVDACQKRYT